MAGINSNRRFIFVSGPPRAGTTLLQNILDSHPDILGGPEFFLLPNIIELRARIQDLVERRKIDAYCSKEEADKQIRLLIESFFIPIMKKYNAKIFSEKTPGSVLVFSHLMSLFPEALFINIVRDPRAIIASMLQVGKKANKMGGSKTQDFTYSVIAAIRYIKRCFDSGFKLSRKAPEKILTVVYEKLVNDPVTETKKICEFIGVAWSQEMLYPSKKIHIAEETTTRENIWYDRDSFYRDPSPDEIIKWKHQLNPFQKLMITLAFCEDQDLDKLGYDLSLTKYNKSVQFIFRSIHYLLSINYRVLRSSFKLVRKKILIRNL